MEPKYKYILGKRDKPTKIKPKFFVLSKIPDERYISSCYHVKDDVYEIEYRGKRTMIDITTNWQKKVDDFINNKAT
jgi:GR25 family glycosyltransferase involved in LPS biosynthesis